MPRFRDTVALVTGGGAGIGAAVARRLSAEGARVVVTGRRAAPIEAVAGEIGGLAVQADVRDDAAMAEAVRQAKDAFGGLDVVVANAGVITEGDVLAGTDADWRTTLDVNVDGVRRTVRQAAPEMVRRGGGAVVVVSSVAGLMGVPSGAAYCTGKAAVIGLCRSMAVDLGPHGIRVNAICPGWVRTPMSEAEMAGLAAARGITVEAAVTAVTRYLPLKRMAAPEEIAACVAFLASEDAAFVTGAVLVADGGGSVVDVGTLAFGDP